MSSRFFLVSTDRARTASVNDATKQALRGDCLEMVTFNVGNGEAIILRRKAKAVLIDGGAGNAKVNKPLGAFLYSYLASKGLTLKAIVASHPHRDHLNADATLLRTGGPQILAPSAKYFENGEAYPQQIKDTLLVELAKLQNSLTRQIVTSAGAPLKLGTDVNADLFVGGKPNNGPAYKSIFMAVRFRDARFLFTGDAYTDYEDKLFNSIHASSLPSHVLKITHHGSDGGTGPNFVAHVKPRISVASTSSDSDHRLEAVVRTRLEDGGKAKVFDTATAGGDNVSGDVILRTDGVTRSLNNKTGILFEVETVVPGRFL